LTVALVGALPGLASGVGHAYGEPWQAPLGRDHALVGRIWDVAGARFIPPATLVERLAASRFVLLGERHDHPDHHRLQAWVLRRLVEAGRRPAVGFEMFAVDDEPAIARYLATRPSNAAGLGDAVGWRRRGWPDWQLYQPIADVALQAGLPVVAANLPQTTARAVAERGLAALDAAQVQRLGLQQPLPPDLQAAMAREIREAHCGHASEAAVAAMVTVQQARDAQMAERLAAAAEGDGAVLIAGAGHVRTDYGVPLHLRRRAPDAAVASLAFLEVRPDRTEATAYAQRWQRTALPFDYVWFTPRLDELDPCRKFEEELKRLRKE
jgi:uncharacterized iron-regulated protein